MSLPDPQHPWSRLAAAARRQADERDTSAPYGFSTRVAALAWTDVRGPVLLERFALRALGLAALLALGSVALNYSAVAPVPAPVSNEEPALAASEQAKLQASGAYAANLLGLSEQVPAKVVFLTSGRARKVKLGKLVIELRPTTPRKVAAAGRTSGLVLAALRYLGKNHITADRIAHLRKTLSAEDRRQLLADLPSAPVWLHPHLRAIAAKESS